MLKNNDLIIQGRFLQSGILPTRTSGITEQMCVPDANLNVLSDFVIDYGSGDTNKIAYEIINELNNILTAVNAFNEVYNYCYDYKLSLLDLGATPKTTISLSVYISF